MMDLLPCGTIKSKVQPAFNIDMVIMDAAISVTVYQKALSIP